MNPDKEPEQLLDSVTRHDDPDDYEKERSGISLPKYLFDELDDFAARAGLDRSRVLALLIQDYLYLFRSQHPHAEAVESWPAGYRIKQWESYHEGNRKTPPKPEARLDYSPESAGETLDLTKDEQEKLAQEIKLSHALMQVQIQQERQEWP